MNSDISTSLSSLSLSSTTAHLQDRKERESLRAQYEPPPSTNEPLTAPTPTRVAVASQPPVSGIWNPEMGIKFGGGPAAHGLGDGAGAGAGAGARSAAAGGGGSMMAAQASSPQSTNSRNLQYPDAGRAARVQAGAWDMSRGLRFA